MIRFILTVLALTLVYALVLTSFQPWDLLLGSLVSALLILLFRPFVFSGQIKPVPGLLRRMLAFFPFALVVIKDISAGFWQVAQITLHLQPLVPTGIIAIPIGERTRNGVAVTTLAMTLSPGSVLVDVDWEVGHMLFHVIDASRPDEIREYYQVLYERYQRAVFP